MPKKFSAVQSVVPFHLSTEVDEDEVVVWDEDGDASQYSSDSWESEEDRITDQMEWSSSSFPSHSISKKNVVLYPLRHKKVAVACCGLGSLFLGGTSCVAVLPCIFAACVLYIALCCCVTVIALILLIISIAHPINTPSPGFL